AARKAAPPGLGRELERLPPSLLARVYTSLGLEWQSLEDHMAILQCVRNVTSDRVFHELTCDASIEMAERPLIKTFRDSAFRLLGVRAGALVRLAPRAIPLIYRNVCRLEQEMLDAPGTARAVISGFVPGPYRFDTFVQSLTGGAHGQLIVAGAEGSAE